MTDYFAGLTVIELADRRNQYVGRLLADGGASVIQIEPPTGSQGRYCGPFVEDQPDPDRCLDYWYYNAGKQSVALDYTTAAGAELMRRLVRSADVFIESSLREELTTLGLDYDSLAPHTENRLVQASITDFGQDGPWRDLLANDVSHLALGGQMGSSGYSDPTVTPIGGQGHQAWHVAGVLCTHAIMTALIHRLSSNKGQYIDCAIHDCAAVCTENAVSDWIYANRVFYRQTGQHARAQRGAPLNIQAGDGRWVNTMGVRLPPYLWANLLQWLQEEGVEGELGDPSYMDETYRATRLRDGTEFYEAFKRLIARLPALEVMRRAQSFGLTWSVIQAPEENLEIKHWDQRNSFVSIDQPGAPKPLSSFLLQSSLAPRNAHV